MSTAAAATPAPAAAPVAAEPTAVAPVKKAKKSTKKTKKVKKAAHKFIINAKQPVEDGLLDANVFKTFLSSKIKVSGKTGNLGANVTVDVDGARLTIKTSNIDFSKRYLKYLTKKFLKKHDLREWIRVVASSKNVYELRYFQFDNEDEEEEADE